MATLIRPRGPVKPNRTRKPAPAGRRLCGLVLTITENGDAERYAVRPFGNEDPETFGVLRAFRLRRLGRSPGQALEALYGVVERLDGSVECDCDEGRTGTCRHAAALVSLGLMGRTATRRNTPG